MSQSVATDDGRVVGLVVVFGLLVVAIVFHADGYGKDDDNEDHDPKNRSDNFVLAGPGLVVIAWNIDVPFGHVLSYPRSGFSQGETAMLKQIALKSHLDKFQLSSLLVKGRFASQNSSKTGYIISQVPIISNMN